MSIENEFRFDVRIQERMVAKGLVKEDELKQRLDSLKDMESESEPLEVEQPGAGESEPEAAPEVKEGL